MSWEFQDQHQLPLYLLFIEIAMEVTDDFSGELHSGQP